MYQLCLVLFVCLCVAEAMSLTIYFMISKFLPLFLYVLVCMRSYVYTYTNKCPLTCNFTTYISVNLCVVGNWNNEKANLILFNINCAIIIVHNWKTAVKFSKQVLRFISVIIHMHFSLLQKFFHYSFQYLWSQLF